MLYAAFKAIKVSHFPMVGRAVSHLTQSFLGCSIVEPYGDMLKNDGCCTVLKAANKQPWGLAGHLIQGAAFGLAR